MEDWVLRALARWPNVPALYGWLGLDRRGRWRIRGETISRPQIIDTLNANYAADERGGWYFQNGPQRGYVSLETAPLVLHAQVDGALLTHTGQLVDVVDAAFLDEDGSLLLQTPLGAAALADADLDWALSRLSTTSGEPVDEDGLATALALRDGAITALRLRLHDGVPPLPLTRLDRARAPEALGYLRDPQPAAHDSRNRM